MLSKAKQTTHCRALYGLEQSNSHTSLPQRDSEFLKLSEVEKVLTHLPCQDVYACRPCQILGDVCSSSAAPSQNPHQTLWFCCHSVRGCWMHTWMSDRCIRNLKKKKAYFFAYCLFMIHLFQVNSLLDYLHQGGHLDQPFKQASNTVYFYPFRVNII